MHTAIEEYLAQLVPRFNQAGIAITEQKEIAYGVQLRLLRGYEVSVLNIYHSAKRGISTIIGGRKDNSLREILSGIVAAEKPYRADPLEMHNWDHWCGSDECGKGDYFGALVVAGFSAFRDDIPHLRKLGVRDSKWMRDQEIVSLAKKLYAEYASRITCIVLRPQKYNEIYADMKRKGQNLNDLLAWQHSRVIQDLYTRDGSIEGALVDRFSKAEKVRLAIKKKLPLLPVIERPGGEADPAVAAASVIARYQFIQAHVTMSRYFDTQFPFGAAPVVKTVAEGFIGKFGVQRLGEVAKLHFVTTSQLKVPAPAAKEAKPNA